MCKGIVLFAVTLIAAWGCDSAPNKRPSPLTVEKREMDGSLVKVVYSSPSVRGREIWGELVPYNKIWRTGANEATIFYTENDVLFHGNPLPAGKYAFFTIPGKEHWEVIVNEDWDQWGTYNYDSAMDMIRLKIKPVKTDQFNERMQFQLTDDSLNLKWENLTISLHLAKN